jgi:hypothetical protein
LCRRLVLQIFVICRRITRYGEQIGVSSVSSKRSHQVDTERFCLLQTEMMGRNITIFPPAIPALCVTHINVYGACNITLITVNGVLC